MQTTTNIIVSPFNFYLINLHLLVNSGEVSQAFMDNCNSF